MDSLYTEPLQEGEAVVKAIILVQMPTFCNMTR